MKFELIVTLIIVIIILLFIFKLHTKQTTRYEKYDIININYNTYFYNNRGFAQLYNKKLNIIVSDSRNHFNEKYFNNIKDGDKIFLTTNLLKDFLNSITINKKITLILGASDTGFPVEFTNKDNLNYIKIIENNNNIIKVFTCNYDLTYKHHKIHPMPLGIDFHTLSFTSSPIHQEKLLLKFLNNSLPFEQRLDNTYSFFQFQMFHRHGDDRFKAINALNKVNFNVYQKNKMIREETWQNMIKYKWIISPHGNGLDCHRTYEAIALGCIPVVRTSTLDILYKDMPIIILQNWEEISLQLLREKTIDALKKSTETITMKYWLNKVNKVNI